MTSLIASPPGRRLRPLLAFIAGCFGVALGYIYVGRPRCAFIALAVLVSVFGFFVVTRWVVTPAGYYGLMASFLSWTLFNAIHPALIARAERAAPRHWYNRWWFYLSVCLAPGIAMSAAGGYDLVRQRALGFATFRAAAASMSPTLEANDFFLVDSWQYRHVAPAVGDVVVFASPQNSAVRYVKRIVGLPGDALEVRDGVVYRNGAPLLESYLHEPIDQRPYGRDMPPVRLGPDAYFVLGDFRDNSRDSRDFGPITRAGIVGPAKFVWLSLPVGNAPPGRFPRRIDSGRVTDGLQVPVAR
jgi:signal peptidase I